jgi:hypothetical protein
MAGEDRENTVVISNIVKLELVVAVCKSSTQLMYKGIVKSCLNPVHVGDMIDEGRSWSFYIVTWMADHLVNTPPPPFQRCFSMLCRVEPKWAKACWLLRSSKNSGSVARQSVNTVTTQQGNEARVPLSDWGFIRESVIRSEIVEL